MFPPTYAVLENRLGNTPGPLDLSILFRPKTLQVQHIRTLQQATQCPPHSSECDAWNRLQSFVEIWKSSSSALQKDLSACWLEFDVQPNRPVPLPRIFAPLHHGVLLSAPPKHGNTQRRIERLLEIFFTDPIQPQLLETIKTFLQALPSSASIVSLGITLTPKPEAVRLSVHGIPYVEMPQWLTAHVPWQQTPDYWEKIVRDLIPLQQHTIIPVDIGPGVVTPKVGFVQKLNSAKGSSEQQWNNLFSYLREQNLLTRDQSQQMTEFPGTTHLNVSGDEAQTPENRGRSFMGFRPVMHAVRKIHHIKMEVHADGRKLAKGYFAFFPTSKP
ncbi:hypothetical protein [Desulfovibrio inopinatus]|uniref:hypothetical protein n=1 Tax=Desulfovibrio inopinatus TaxID=102109 RepID=UPI0012EC2620|nr:hypothetical protein [Desulfovibrio inopinatus]